MLIHIPEVLTKQQVAEFRVCLSQADWVDGKATVGAQVKKNRQLPVDGLVARELVGLTDHYHNLLRQWAQV